MYSAYMRTGIASRGRRGFTKWDLLIVVLALGVLAAVLLPALAKSGSERYFGCINNLRQIGLAMRMWANESEDRFPWEMDPPNDSNLHSVVDYFRAASNELSSPKLLTCPSSGKSKASSWNPNAPGGLPATGLGAARHISYFLNIDTRYDSTNGLQAGDSTLTNLAVSPSGLALLTPNSSPRWGEGRHWKSGTFGFRKPMGHVVFTDGSVSRLDAGELRDAARVLVPATNRLLLP